MTDDINKKTIRDHRRVFRDEEYELDYLAEKFHISRDLVKKAVEAVGIDHERVEAYLDKNV